MAGQLEPDGTRPVKGIVVALMILGGAALVFAVLALSSGVLGG